MTTPSPHQLPQQVRLVEVGPRDGLQNETATIPLSTKVELIDRLGEAGLSSIEVGAFVSPKWVPKMADTDRVLTKIRHYPGVSYSVLVPNMRGYRDAVKSKVQEIAIFTAASETFSQKNTHCSIDESLQRFGEVCGEAKSNHIRVRGYISCVLGCPYEGKVNIGVVADIAQRLMELGCYEVSLGDTIGIGTPLKAREMVTAVMRQVAIEHLAVHFHDTYGQALANIFATLELGIQVVDSSVAGLGGCPYAKGATGNVATEDVLYMLNDMGIETGVDLDKIIETALFISQRLNRPPSSSLAKLKLNS